MAQTLAPAGEHSGCYNRVFVHVTAIIAAGGRGERFGAGRPKQLLALGGVSILQRSVDALLAHPLHSRHGRRAAGRARGRAARLSAPGGEARRRRRGRRAPAGFGGARVRACARRRRDRGDSRCGASARERRSHRTHRRGRGGRRRGRGRRARHRHRQARRCRRPRDRNAAARARLSWRRRRRRFASPCCATRWPSPATPPTRPRLPSAPGTACAWSRASRAT